MDKGHQVLQQFQALESERTPLDHEFEELFEYTMPERGQRFLHKTTDGAALSHNAREDRAKIYDSTAADSIRLLAASMDSGLTPSNSKWQTLGVFGTPTSSLSARSRAWLEESSTRLHQIIHNSNYDSIAYEFFVDLCIVGMAGLYIEPDEENGIRYELWSLADMWCAETLKRGRIDTVYRICYFTYQQLIERFGKNNIPSKIHQEYKTGEKTKKPRRWKILHTIRPRIKNGKQANGTQRRTMPWESVYVCMTTGTVIQESGYHEMPVIVPRWMVRPQSVYALGPVSHAMPDIKSINRYAHLTLINGELATAGTYVYQDDGILNPNVIRIGPRELIPAMDVNNIRPLPKAADFNIAQWQMERLERQIRKTLMSDQLQPADQKYQTATAVQVNVQLIRRLLGPVYSRFQTEFLTPMIERVYGICERDGLLPEKTQEIEELVIQPSYQSPLARAQRLEDLDQMAQFEETITPMLQVNPGLLDLYDTEKAARLKAELLGVPESVMRDEQEVSRIRRERQQAQEEAVQQQAMLAQQQEEQ